MMRPLDPQPQPSQGRLKRRSKAVRPLRPALLLMLALSLVALCLLQTACNFWPELGELRSGQTQTQYYSEPSNEQNGTAAPTGWEDLEQTALKVGLAAEQAYGQDLWCSSYYGGPRDFNTAEYRFVNENTFLSARHNPFSTFGADVDTASYSLMRRHILAAEPLPPKDAIRVEEFVNYFDFPPFASANTDPVAVQMEIANCPWNAESKLLALRLQTKPIDQEERQAANLVFLLDVSGSMASPDKLPLVQKAFTLLSEQLKDNDRISLVSYASGAEVLAEGLTGSDRGEIQSLLQALSAGGSTHGSAGIKTAYELARRYFIKGGSNRVILATDGDLNLGLSSEAALTALIKDEKESGVFLSVLGFGQDNLKDNKLEALADNGNGQYAYIDSIFAARRSLVEQLGTQLEVVAQDVKLQVEFNPAQIKAYRLIGYENRLLSREDFANDKKDGGELGAGQHLTALYEVLLPDSAQEIEIIKGRYQVEPDPAAASPQQEELLCFNLRYKMPGGSASKLYQYILPRSALQTKLSDRLTVEAAAAAFALNLRRSEHIKDFSLRQVSTLLDGLAPAASSSAVRELRYLLDLLCNAEARAGE